MSLLAGLQILAVGIFACLLISAAVSDFRQYLIPNSICLAIVGLYPIYLAFSSLPIDWVGGLIAGAAVLAIGIGLFSLGVTGGGDVKLLAATALWAGTERVLPLLLVMSLAGGVLALAYWLAQGRDGEKAEADGDGSELQAMTKVRLPYGIAIATGGLFVAGQIAFL